MKLYCVTDDDGFILGIFSHEGKADLYVDKFSTHQSPKYVTPFELDHLCEIPDDYYYWRVTGELDTNGGLRNLIAEELPHHNNIDIKELIVYVESRRGYSYATQNQNEILSYELTVDCWANSKSSAKSIVCGIIEKVDKNIEGKQTLRLE